MLTQTEKSSSSRAPKGVNFSKQDPTEALSVAQSGAAFALEKKADNVLILDVSQLTSYADYFVICSAPSERQVQAIARHVQNELKDAGKTALGVEGMEEGNWVLADFGDVIFHVFLDTARSYYDLEGFWADAKKIALNASASTRLKGS